MVHTCFVLDVDLGTWILSSVLLPPYIFIDVKHKLIKCKNTNDKSQSKKMSIFNWVVLQDDWL